MIIMHEQNGSGLIWKAWPYQRFKWWLVASLLLLIVITLLWHKLEQKNVMALDLCGRYWSSSDLIEREALSKDLLQSGIFLCNKRM
jgi:hypothetical protein